MCRKGSQFSGHLTENRECAKSQGSQQEEEERVMRNRRQRGRIRLAKSAAQARSGNIFVCYPKPLGLATVTGQGGEGTEQVTCSFATSWRKAAINAALLIEPHGKGMRQMYKKM